MFTKGNTWLLALSAVQLAHSRHAVPYFSNVTHSFPTAPIVILADIEDISSNTASSTFDIVHIPSKAPDTTRILSHTVSEGPSQVTLDAPIITRFPQAALNAEGSDGDDSFPIPIPPLSDYNGLSVLLTALETFVSTPIETCWPCGWPATAVISGIPHPIASVNPPTSISEPSTVSPPDTSASTTSETQSPTSFTTMVTSSSIPSVSETDSTSPSSTSTTSTSTWPPPDWVAPVPTANEGAATSIEPPTNIWTGSILCAVAILRWL